MGDFDGNGQVDLATYQPNPVNKFFFDLNPHLSGPHPNGHLNATLDAASTFGFIGVRTLPVAADMDHDGTTDIGLWVPDRSGVAGDNTGEWYFLTSNFATPTTGTVDTLNTSSRPRPWATTSSPASATATPSRSWATSIRRRRRPPAPAARADR